LGLGGFDFDETFLGEGFLDAVFLGGVFLGGVLRVILAMIRVY
jgi:hypothetical protein